MSPGHIFVVEDEENLLNTLALNLRISNYIVTAARSGNEALRLFSETKDSIDLALLDIMLPDLDGFGLCRKLREQKPALPVIFLSAKNEAADKREGLRLGADDYITKPFDLEELLLRISNLLRRTQKETAEQYSFNGCSINFRTFEITGVRGTKHTLSKKEIGLLELLTSRVSEVISRDEIIEKLWEPAENASSRTIDNYILNFRKYFEPDPKNPRHFHSIRGVGYKFVP
jgi:two-component system, OmpR family, alkaline phosphatase synthesis response regulator PhoP